MEEEEARLRFAIIARVGNASREFSPAQISTAVAEAAGLAADHFPTFPTYLESYLIICSTREARDRALGVSPVPIAATMLSLRPWTWLVRANSTVLYKKIGIGLDGIPEHAWDLDTASKLLARHAWIERLDPATANKTDFTTSASLVPRRRPGSKTLCIAEPEPTVVYPDEEMARIFANVEPYLRQKQVLRYPVHIHLRSIADFSSRTTSPSASSPSDDGDSGPDGNPSRSYGFRSGTGPRLSGFPRRQIGGDGGSAAAGGRDVPECSRRFVVNGEGGRSTEQTASGPVLTRPPPTDLKSNCATNKTDGDGAPVATGQPDAAAAAPFPAGKQGTDQATSCVLPTREDPHQQVFDPMMLESLIRSPTIAPKGACLHLWSPPGHGQRLGRDGHNGY
ncbi:unnamed protein product [Urochloa humidicola]